MGGLTRSLMPCLLLAAACADNPDPSSNASDASTTSPSDAGTPDAAQDGPDAGTEDSCPEPLQAPAQCQRSSETPNPVTNVQVQPGQYILVQAQVEQGSGLTGRLFLDTHPITAADEPGTTVSLALVHPASTPALARLELAWNSTVSIPAHQLRVSAVNWATQVPCTKACKEFMMFPATTSDAHLPVSPPRYMFGRRELVQTVVAAALAVRHADAETSVVGVGDLSQVDGQIPGTDVGTLRHPAPSHQNGFSVDVAYYAANNDNLGNTPPCPTNDYSFCNGPHTLHLQRNVRFMLALAREPRLSQIIVDPVMEQDLRSELSRQSSEPGADQQAVQKLGTILMSGIAYHTDHMHIAVFRECNDGVDNDHDGDVDTADQGCSSATDDSEDS